MNKKSIVIIFNSKYGWTGHYAKWMEEALSCKAFNSVGVDEVDLYQYDVIIYGAGVYADTINGAKTIFSEHNLDLFSSREVILFTVGLNDPSNSNVRDNLKRKLQATIPADIYKQLTIFHLRGGIDYSRLKFFDRLMMFAVYLFNRVRSHFAKGNQQVDINVMLQTYGGTFSLLDRKSLQPLIDYVNNK